MTPAQADAFLSRIDEIEAELGAMRAKLDTAPAQRRRWLYTREDAIRKKQAVDYAYRLGQISYDRRRGIKAAVTRLTVGWVPPCERPSWMDWIG